MKRKIILHGHLRKRFGKEFEMAVTTAGEALRALNANFPGDFIEALKEGSYALVRGKRKGGLSLDLEDVNTLRLGAGDLHVIPVTKGSKRGNGGALKIIVGVALIGASIFFAGGTLAGMSTALPGALGSMGLTAGHLGVLGLSLVLAGVSQMLAPKEKPVEETGREDSFMFNGPTNSQEQGNPIPLIYGRVITGSIPISAGLDIEQIGSFRG